MRISSISSNFNYEEFKEENLKRELMNLLQKALNQKNFQTLRKLNEAYTVLKSGNIIEAERIIKIIKSETANQDNTLTTRDEKKSSSYFRVPKLNENPKNRKNNWDIRNSSDKIVLQDKSNDPAVSFKYPQAVPSKFAFLYINAHEGEHVREIISKAVLEGKMAYVFVRYFTSYDSKGNLIFVGGVTWGKIIDRLI